jgi:hypothetical protein
MLFSFHIGISGSFGTWILDRNFNIGNNNSINHHRFLETSLLLAKLCAKSRVQHFLMVEDGSVINRGCQPALSTIHHQIIVNSNEMCVSILRPGYMVFVLGKGFLSAVILHKLFQRIIPV